MIKGFSMLRTLIIGIIVGIMTLPVFARVIEVEGSARIVGGDTQAARDQAIENVRPPGEL